MVKSKSTTAVLTIFNTNWGLRKLCLLSGQFPTAFSKISKSAWNVLITITWVVELAIKSQMNAMNSTMSEMFAILAIMGTTLTGTISAKKPTSYVKQAIEEGSAWHATKITGWHPVVDVCSMQKAVTTVLLRRKMLFVHFSRVYNARPAFKVATSIRRVNASFLIQTVTLLILWMRNVGYVWMATTLVAMGRSV